MTDNTDTKGTLNGADSDGDDGKFTVFRALLSCPWQFKCYALWIWHVLVCAKITDFLCDCHGAWRELHSGPCTSHNTGKVTNVQVTFERKWQHVLLQGVPKPMSDCPGKVEIQFGQVNLWHNLSVGQAHF